MNVMTQDEQQFEDLLNSAEVREWLHRAETEMFPGMAHAACSLLIRTNSRLDPQFALEVGAAILMEKPLILLSVHGSPIPKALRKIASAIVEVDDPNSRESFEKLAAAISVAIKEV